MLLGMMRHRALSAVALFFALELIGCSSIHASSGNNPAAFGSFQKKAAGQKVTQEELQANLLRFESQFSAGVEDASRDLESSPNMDVRYAAARNRLNYATNSLEIATGASPETNLLDMITFVELSKGALENHWIPKVFGAKGKPLDLQFRRSEEGIWKIADRVLNADQEQRLQGYILKWQKLHPKQVDVESVRLSVFAFAGGLNPQEESDIGGLFASVEEATQAADAARLFAARALYYTERAPTLMRLQAKVGSREILYEVGTSLEQAKGPALKQMAGIAGNVEKEGDRFLIKFVAAGAVLIVFFWGMALVSRLAYLSLSRRSEKRRGEDQSPKIRKAA
jgi:hypothetical protein